MDTKSGFLYPKLKYSFDKEKYLDLYKRSILNPEKFWSVLALKELVWFKKWDKVFEKRGNSFKWFLGGKLNITYNCLDRHIASGGGKKTAYIWVNEDGKEIRITYRELLNLVNKTANFLLSLGLTKGDTVTIYMPLTIEQIALVLACARVGIIHSVVYAGFSYQALWSRILDAKSKFIFTSDYTYRRGKAIDLLTIVRKSVKNIDFIKKIIVFKREEKTSLKENELDFEKEISKCSSILEALLMDSEDPLFILYTSGTTGKPKGVLHSLGGYSLYTHITTKYVFDVKKDDIYWCTADSGWITGHSYMIYGPLSNHATIVIYEGVPDYPDPEVWWKIIEKYKVSIFYTSPTAIRMLMSFGDIFPRKHNLSSLRVLGSVGEPINEGAWLWYWENVGKKKCAIVDTWWQTETGGQMLTTLPGLGQKPGYVGLPFFGIEALIVDKKDQEVPPGEKGYLVIKNAWPAILRTCWNDPKRYEEYWKGKYFYTGDIALKDKDGYIRILGRSDDVIVLAGHNISSAELESILTSHELVTEAGVIGIPDKIKGQKIIAYVNLIKGTKATRKLEKELIEYVGDTYGKYAKPQKVKFIEKLPKTRSGKIMRRVLKAMETGGKVGDTSTLES